MADKEVPYTITRACWVAGEQKKVGDIVQMTPGQGNYLVALGKAIKGEQKIQAPKPPKAEK